MMVQPGMREVGRFRELIAARLGLQVDEARLGSLACLLAEHGGADCGAYLDALAAGADGAAELAHLAPGLTVGETYFFRHIEQIRAYAEVALPHCLQRGGLVRVLSAGCASGDEAYSLAIAARELLGQGAAQLALSALDINPRVLDKALRARYTAWSLREFPAALKARCFRADGDGFVLDDAIRRMVRFEARNLARPDPDFWHPGAFDIVFCRNVLMYFTPAQAQAVVARIAGALTPGGYLFLGHAETLRGLSADFHLCHTHGAFYYQRKEAVSAPVPVPAAPEPLPEFLPAARAQPAAADTAWIGAIGRAAERIQALTGSVPPAASCGPAGAPDLQDAREHLHQERYAQTLELLGGLPPRHATDPDVLLLKAVSLNHSGALAEAEAVCRQLLAQDELNAGAHYVLALCREGAGDLQGALAHNQSAAYLDPGFAMARLHIGLLARRQGEREAARRELAQALQLLQKEDPARLLLFGGGFRREALIALCRAELAAFGECA